MFSSFDLAETGKKLRDRERERERERETYLFILFVAVLGLRCCAQPFSSCGERGLPFVAMRGLLIAVASLVEEHRL